MERVIVRRGSYHDSAYLMRLTRELAALEGVEEAVVLMGTDMNRALLVGAGFAPEPLADAGPMDLVVALRAGMPEAFERAEAALAALLSGAGERPAGVRPNAPSLPAALSEQPGTNLVSVAVPGAYAAYVAGQALDAGRHVFLFSNNVALEDEIALKRRAVEAGLLLMGPDCGTAILAGVGLGFANRVRRGAIGLVGASGTGLQEITCQLHARGAGVSQAIGTGSRDLSLEVAGRMTEFGLRLLADDPDSRVLVLVAKHPHPEVADRLHGLLRSLGKPAVVRYLGQDGAGERDGVFYADSLDEAACAAVALAAGKPAGKFDVACGLQDDRRALLVGRERVSGRLVGLFGGGSLAAEAGLRLRRAGLSLREPDGPLAPDRPLPGREHLIVDVGEDFYTVGRPHPMVDQTVRCELLRTAGVDPGVGLVLFDLVLGDGAHLDPAPELAAAVAAVRAARAEGGPLFVASVCGTELDPQDAGRQRRVLADAGVQVQPSAARAAELAAALLVGGAR